ncbi:MULTISPECIES: hypothetical protein [unclassified Pseudomonas]|uniref:hypothetical protein n=1 Tax=unclassified Pseudomonas TaxID=196821 RepID=UPI000CD198D2|nr:MULTISPECIES: hypothetical protein [unclassified Pseudomonas]POA28614.1 hypothetical protein C1887_22585 [Pseudomonas sp. GW456-R21]POA64499.1 hypothetical protein C1884_21055 [Pseudomonas sp. GW460-R15]
MTTYQERFAEACKTSEFANHDQMIGGYVVWDVQHVREGQKVTIDGPFFTEDEARVSAELLRGAFRGARAYQVIYDRIWNYDPRREQVTFDQARMSRSLLAIRLGVKVPTNSATSALE